MGRILDLSIWSRPPYIILNLLKMAKPSWGNTIKPYAHKPDPKPGKITSKDLPKTSTLSHVPSSQRNLTLHDWLHVVNWFNKNQPVTQEVTVNHFKTLHDEVHILINAQVKPWVKCLKTAHYFIFFIYIRHILLTKKARCSAWIFLSHSA